MSIKFQFALSAYKNDTKPTLKNKANYVLKQQFANGGKKLPHFLFIIMYRCGTRWHITTYTTRE